MTSKYDKPWESADTRLIEQLKKRIAELEAELAALRAMYVR